MSSTDFLEHILTLHYASSPATSSSCSSSSLLEFTAPPGLIKPKLADIKARSKSHLFTQTLNTTGQQGRFIQKASLQLLQPPHYRGLGRAVCEKLRATPGSILSTLESSTASSSLSSLSEMFTSIGLLCINQTHLKLHFSPKGMACPNLCQLHQPVPHLPPRHLFKVFPEHSYPWWDLAAGRQGQGAGTMATSGTARFLTGGCHFQNIFTPGEQLHTPASPPSQPQSQIPSIQAIKTGIIEKKQTWKKNVQATSNIKSNKTSPKCIPCAGGSWKRGTEHQGVRLP